MRESEPALETLAFLYANGELEGTELAAFERRLAAEQSAREALCQAVERADTLSGRVPRQPGVGYRAGVRERLRPRSYRGHPAIWTIVGAVAAASLLFVALPAGPTPDPTPSVNRERDAETPNAARPEAPLEKAAIVYTELSNSDHLVNAVSEMKERRDRWVTKRPMPANTRTPKTGMKQG